MLEAALLSKELLFEPNREIAKTPIAATKAIMSAYSINVPPPLSESIIRRYLVMG